MGATLRINWSCERLNTHVHVEEHTQLMIWKCLRLNSSDNKGKKNQISLIIPLFACSVLSRRTVLQMFKYQCTIAIPALCDFLYVYFFAQHSVCLFWWNWFACPHRGSVVGVVGTVWFVASFDEFSRHSYTQLSSVMKDSKVLAAVVYKRIALHTRLFQKIRVSGYRWLYDVFLWSCNALAYAVDSSNDPSHSQHHRLTHCIPLLKGILSIWGRKFCAATTHSDTDKHCHWSDLSAHSVQCYATALAECEFLSKVIFKSESTSGPEQCRAG